LNEALPQILNYQKQNNQGTINILKRKTMMFQTVPKIKKPTFSKPVSGIKTGLKILLFPYIFNRKIESDK
jgi:hypothetical protein